MSKKYDPYNESAMSSVTWCGRARVEEKAITPEQYKMFFGRYQYGISFKVANTILKYNQEGIGEEIVPADELNKDAIDQIKTQVLDDEALEGTIEYEGQTLHWAWTPKVTNADGVEIDLFRLDRWMISQILEQMLDDESHWGVIA